MNKIEMLQSLSFDERLAIIVFVVACLIVIWQTEGFDK